MAEPNFFDQYDPAPAQGVQLRGPDPKKPGELTLQGQSIDKNAQDLQLGNINIGLKREELSNQGKELRGKAIDRETGIRKEFENLDPVKQYRTILPIYSSIIKSGNDGAGDLNIIYGLSKIMDPNSAVREGELALAQDTGSAGEQLKGYYKYVSSGGRLTPDVRNQLLREVRSRTGAIADSYNQARKEYRDRSQRYSMNPLDVIGGHPGAAHQQAEADFLGRPVRNLDGSQGAVPRDYAQQIAASRNQDNPLFQALEAEYRAQGIPFGYDESGKPVPERPEGQTGPVTQSFMNGVGDVVEGLGDIPGLLANPITAGVNWAAGTNYRPDFGQNLRDTLGLPDNGNPTASAINEGASSALGGAGIAGLIARGFGGTAGSVASTVAEQPIRQSIAGGGAGLASERAEAAGLGPLGQAGAGLLGGLTAYGGANALLRTAKPAVNPVMEAATQQRVSLRPADVGGATTKRMDAAAAQSAFSASSISNAAKKTQDDLHSALGRQARSQGDVLPEDEAGQALREPLKGYSQKQATRIGRVYDRAEERAKGVKIKALQGVSFLDEQIARFKDAPGGESIAAELQSVRDKIANGVSVTGIRDARTILSQGVHDGKLRSSLQKGIYKQFLGLLSKDIEAGLSAAGRKDALNLFRVADKAWSERIDYIDDVLQPVIGGNKSGEDILRAVEGMTQGRAGGVARLNELLRELPHEQAGSIRATIIDRMGRAKAGQQDDTGQAFSANTFLTNWNNMSPKGKAMMFGSGELRKNLDQIAKLASATKETGRFANTSNTGGSINNNVIAMGSAGAVSEVATGYGMATLAALVSAQLLTGKLLASQAFTRWLARFPSSPKGAANHAGQLAQIAAREPLIANDIGSVQQFLGGNSYRAAASSEDQQQDRR